MADMFKLKTDPNLVLFNIFVLNGNLYGELYLVQVESKYWPGVCTTNISEKGKNEKSEKVNALLPA